MLFLHLQVISAIERAKPSRLQSAKLHLFWCKILYQKKSNSAPPTVEERGNDTAHTENPFKNHKPSDNRTSKRLKPLLPSNTCTVFFTCCTRPCRTPIIFHRLDTTDLCQRHFIIALQYHIRLIPAHNFGTTPFKRSRDLLLLVVEECSTMSSPPACLVISLRTAV